MTSLRFIVGDEIRTLNAEHAAKHRRCLFTEAGRQQMSNELIDSVTTRGQEDPGQILLDMEQDCLETNADQCFEMFRGPFGIAKWETGGIQNTTSTQVDFDFDVDVEAGLGVDGGDIGPDDTLTQWLLSADTSNVSDSMQPYEPVLNTLGLNTSQLLSSPSPLEIPSSLSLPNEDPKSWFLLSYYRDYIMRLISPLQHHSHTTSDPWNSLVMPCAMATMAELTLGANANHAPLALLNALLATSAFHLHASLSGGSAASAVAREWMVSGKEYTARARGYLAACLVEHARSAGQKKSKYKEILMAVLSLGDAFMVKGDADKRLEHLLYAEQFIRAHGFKKPALSRKRRILHHCYAYMRIMAETTRSNISSQTDDTPSRDTDSPEDSENIKDNDRFCTSRWTAVSDKMMIMEKDPDTAKRDLHLEVPGHWTSTLFPELYGIAESFLLLLSQVIRLANERDITIGQDSGGDLGLREFTLRAKALENSIYRLTSSSSNAGPGTGTTTVTVQAMYTALLIFFYRRVHNLDAMLLQRNVLSVQTYLVQIQQENHDSHRSVAMIWPAFVAACEALLPESQGFFAAWFEAMFEKTGLVSISLVKGVCEFIWRRRTECPDGLSWPEVLKKGGRVLCT